jgi:integrase
MRGRHANGEGTIYQRKDGRWEGAIYVLTTGGTSKRQSLYGKTRADVHTKLTSAKMKQQQGILVADKVWRLGEYLDYWLEEVVRPNRRPATYDRYEANVRLYLKPDLGQNLMSRLSVPALQQYLNHHLATGQSPRKVQIMREVLSSALTTATRQETVVRNVARLVTLPGRERADITPWTLREATHFLEVSKDHWLYPAFVLLVLYGLRRGEVLGLRWQDVDFDRGELHIRQQVYRAGGVVREGPVKTRAGQRKLPLLGLIRQLLVPLHGAAGSSQWDLIFTAKTRDSPVEPQVFTSTFHRVCDQHDVRRIKLHHIRHTTATLLKNLGVPARDTQLILGHSHVSITQQIYQHDDMGSRRQSLEQLERVLVPSAGRDARSSDDAEDVRDDRINDTLTILPSVQGNRPEHWGPPALPSVLPSKVLLQQEKVPIWHSYLYKFMAGMEGFEPQDIGLKSSGVLSSTTVHSRLAKITLITQKRKRQWHLGVVAVNLAVKLMAGFDGQ